jgi:choice-of-anchor B domain-containing protein
MCIFTKNINMRKVLLYTLLLFLSANLIGQSNLNLDSVAHFQYPSTITLNDIWGYEDSLGNEYALVGKRNGLSVISLADTNNLVEVYSESSVFSVWRDIKTWGHYAYVTNETSGGLAIYDLSTLPDSVKGVTYHTGTNYPINSAHNIFIDEKGVAFLFGSNDPQGSSETIMLDVATSPGQPIELGRFDSLYLHDGYARNDTLYGSAVYAGLLLVIDISDKLNPVIVGSASTPSNFTHNSWPSDNSKTIFTTDEVSGGFVGAYDVSNPSNIVLKDRIRSKNTLDVIPHNAHVLNDFVITSYYTSGVSVVDGSRPENLIEVAHFDTSPNFSGNTFNGNWGAYPYLSSGLLILSDMENGLYVLRPKYQRASYLEGRVSNRSGVALSQVNISIQNSNHIDSTNLLGDYKSGSPQDGYFTVVARKNGYNVKTIDSVLLVAGQVTNLNIVLDILGVGIEANNSLKNQIKVFPKPFKNDLSIKLTNPKLLGSEVIIFDVNSKLVKEFKIVNTEMVVGTSELNSGIYLMRIVSPRGNVITQKILKY